ncbi:MAG TPA: oligoendopeptidase F [bacterium]|nr:oligoendopeptidase F [bacterium]
MKKTVEAIIMIALLSAGLLQSQTRERAAVPLRYTWNLQDLYATDDEWRKEKEKHAGQIPALSALKGTLSTPAGLLQGLKTVSGISKELVRLANYSSMKSDQDTRDAGYTAMRQEMSQIFTDLQTQTAFLEPEILKLGRQTVETMIRQEPGLQDYKMYLLDLFRRNEHKLSEKEEKLIAEAGLMAESPYNIYTLFSNAELPYPQVTLSDGSTVLVDQAGYQRYRAVANRQDREKVFQAFFASLEKFQRSLGAALNGQIKKDLFYSRARNYPNTLAASLDENNIPEAVYFNLLKNVNDHLPTFHRYLNLRKKMLKVDQLKYSDLYVPVVPGLELEYTIEQAQTMILEALKPLGKEYGQVIEQAFNERWVDVYPTTGKRSGAYSNGDSYDVHPYILMNYNGQYNDVSTLAHELGHSMHSYLSNKTQPYPTASYSIFVAEVASTLNEALLIDQQLKKIKDDQVRLSLLMNHLDGIKGTVFRQTQFAEFEWAIHQRAERGEPLTGEVFSQLYGDIVRKYYGHDSGVCLIDDLFRVEWAFIPHFYYNYYVYQYSTSFTASTALAEKIIAGEKGAVDQYLAFLSAGGSEYPIDLLKKAGVDMTSAEPFQKTMAVMNRTMDEIEKILAKK